MDLEPIKARLAAATPGPWDTRRSEQPRHDTWSVTICQAEGGAGVVTWHARTAVPRHEGNIALIANAPVDLAALVAEVEHLRGGILAALDNLEGGPEAIQTAEGALRLALADG